MTVTIDRKMCSRCGPDVGPKPAGEFYRRSTSPDGLQSWCKACAKATRGEWADRNREALRLLDRRSRSRRLRSAEYAGIVREQKREANRRRNGVTPDSYRVSAHMRAVKREEFDVRLFVSWLRPIVATYPGGIAGLASTAGVAEKTLRRILKGEQRDVGIDIVDRCLIAVDDEGALDALCPLDGTIAAMHGKRGPA